MKRRARIEIDECYQSWGSIRAGGPKGWAYTVHHRHRSHYGWSKTYEDALRKALVAAEAMERGLPPELPFDVNRRFST